MWRLTLEDDDGNVHTVPLDRAAYTLGRAEDNDVMLEERNVSRHHARLEQSPDGRWWLHDAGSRYGCYLNGKRLDKPAALRLTDVAQVGGVCLGLVPSSDLTAIPTRSTVPTPLPWSPTVEPDQLYVFDGPYAGREVPLGGKPVALGVGEGCDVQFPADFAPPGIYAVVRPLAGGRFEVLRKSDAVAMRIRLRLVERMLLEDQDLLRFEAAAGKGEVRFRFLAARRVRLTGLGTPTTGASLRTTRRAVAEAALDQAPTIADVRALLAAQPDNWRAWRLVEGEGSEVVEGPPPLPRSRRRTTRRGVVAVVVGAAAVATGLGVCEAARSRGQRPSGLTAISAEPSVQTAEPSGPSGEVVVSAVTVETAEIPASARPSADKHAPQKSRWPPHDPERPIRMEPPPPIAPSDAEQERRKQQCLTTGKCDH